MTKILTFPKQRVASYASQQTAEKADLVVFDDDGLLSFSRPDQLHKDVAPSRYVSSRDWSNQELASIYRVKHLLDAAHIQTELDRGVSDEGDPWCVFCTMEGDVFIHLSRIDGLYWLDSPNLTAPLNGQSFDDLVCGFTNSKRVGHLSDEAEGPAKVVRLRSSDALYLHPSVMLAALVWSLYFGSEDLLVFGAKHDVEETPNTDMVEPWLASFNAEHEKGGLPKELMLDKGEHGLWSGAQEGDEHKALASLGGQAPISMMLGLGSIAVASGFILESHWKAVILAVLQVGVGVSPEDADIPPAAAVLAQSIGAIMDFVSPDVAARFVADGGADNLNPVEAAHADALFAQIAQLVGLLEHQVIGASETAAPAEMVEKLEGVENSLEYAVLDGSGDEVFPHAASVSAQSLIEVSKSGIIVSLMRDIFSDADVAPLEFGGATYLSDFAGTDISRESLNLVEQTILSVDTGSARGGADVVDAASAFAAFDALAKEFVYSQLARSDDIKFVSSVSELVFVDLAAYADTGAEVTSMVWDTGDGGTVSFIGLKADFMEFGLI